jgi:threonine dehydratase
LAKALQTKALALAKGVGELMSPIARKFVDRVALVPDEALEAAQPALWKVLRIVAAPGGAADFAALLSGGYQAQPDERVGVLVCGGDTTAVDFGRSGNSPNIPATN